MGLWDGGVAGTAVRSGQRGSRGPSVTLVGKRTNSRFVGRVGCWGSFG